MQEYVERQENEIDFAEADLAALDEQFIASEGTSDDTRETADKVSQYWKKGEEKAIVNAMLGGTADMATMSGFTAGQLIDGNTDALVSTNYHDTADITENPEMATVTFKESAYYEISKVQIYWRDERGCPEDFEIQVFNGNEWETKVKKEGYTYSTNPLSEEIDPTKCNAIRLVATKLRSEAVGGTSKYCLQLREFEAYGTACTNAALGGTPNMEIMLSDEHPASFLNDGNKSGWTTTNFAASDDVEKTAAITFANNAYYKISHVQIFWNNSLGCPIAFEIQAQTSEGWKTVAAETNNDTGKKIWSRKIEPVECNAIRLKATKLSLGENTGYEGSYCLMLNELEAWGEKVEYLKTNKEYNSDEPVTTLLTWKSAELENFKAEIEMVYFDATKTKYGLYFGQSAPAAITDAKCVMPVFWNSSTYGGLRVDGADQSSPQYLEENIADYVTETSGKGMFNPTGSDSVYTKGSINGFPTAFDDGNIQTLNVEVVDSVLKLWWTGFEKAAWTVKLADYTGGYISLMSRGNDQGGIRSFRVSEILDVDLQSNVDMSVEPLGDYTIVSVTNDIAGGILKNSALTGNVKYDAAKFEYCTTVITDSEAGVLENVVAAGTNGSVNVSFSSYNANAVAKLYFKNIANELDYSGFGVEVGSITRANGKPVKSAATETITYDYTGAEGTPDKLVDVRDLVRAAKENKAPSELRRALVGVGSDWVAGVVGEVKDTVYVDSVKGSYTGEGTLDSPLNSMTLAAYQVADKGTIHVVGNYAFSAQEFSIGMGQKSITITGSGGTLDLTGIRNLEVCGDVTFKDITVKAAGVTIYANGHHFTVESSVTYDGYVGEIYGGNNGEMYLESTNLNLLAGNYNIIYGGSRGASTITGDTHVTIGGTVNNNRSDFQVTDHKYNETVCLYGGSYNGLVKGNTNVTVEGNATTSYVHGGGWGSNSEVRGTCNVYGNGGELCGYYGGSLAGKVYSTNVVITAGKMEQVFGGSWSTPSTGNGTVFVQGNTNVTINGGTITRRVYGGCYSEYTGSWTQASYVKGTSKVVVNANAFSFGSDLDTGICAESRCSENHADEDAILEFATQEIYDALSEHVGSSYFKHLTGYDKLYIGGVLQ